VFRPSKITDFVRNFVQVFTFSVNFANFSQSAPVKEFLKSANIWEKYKQKCGGMFFDSRCRFTDFQMFLEISIIIQMS